MKYEISAKFKKIKGYLHQHCEYVLSVEWLGHDDLILHVDIYNHGDWQPKFPLFVNIETEAIKVFVDGKPSRLIQWFGGYRFGSKKGFDPEPGGVLQWDFPAYIEENKLQFPGYCLFDISGEYVQIEFDFYIVSNRIDLLASRPPEITDDTRNNDNE